MDEGAVGPSERKDEAETPDHAIPETFGRKLPRGVQLMLLAIGAVIVVTGFATALFPSRAKPEAEQTSVVTPDGAVQLTDQQWAGMRVVPVKAMPFFVSQETDGNIAIDDDLVTQVFSPYSGRVTKLFSRVGDVVKPGDPMLAIDASELAQGQNDLISAVATLKTAVAQLNLAQTNEKRQHALYLSQGAALKDWQQSQVDLATAEGGQRSAEIALAAVRNRLRILGMSDDQVTAIEAAGNILNMQSGTTVAAPIGGTVTQRQVGLGQNIVNQAAGGSTPVFSIGDLSKVWLVANAREVDGPLIHLGDAVNVTVLAYPDRLFKAKITFVAPSIDPNTHRLPVRAEVENPDGALKPGMFASFRIITGAETMSPGVPESAVTYEGETARVWVGDPSKKTVAIRQVQIGRIDDGYVQILGGLKVGESVVTSGAVFIDRIGASD
jgi:cobalt-zinc-cadmium efflux system membrane fusion protein